MINIYKKTMHRIGKDTMLYLLNKKKNVSFFFFCINNCTKQRKNEIKKKPQPTIPS